MLGTTQAIRDDGSTVPVGGARLRALLTALALRPGRAVPVASLIEEVWDGDPPADGPAALQALVGRLRRALGREAVGSGEGGYWLVAARDDIDLYRFERLARAAAQASPAEAAALYDEALALWRGEPLGSLPGSGPEAARWEALRLDARRGRLHAALALGEAERVLPELTALCAGLPLDESLQALRIRALRDAGRPAEALAAYEEVRRDLATRLGTTPGPALRALHRALLTDPTAAPGRSVPPAGPGPLPPEPTAGTDRTDRPTRTEQGGSAPDLGAATPPRPREAGRTRPGPGPACPPGPHRAPPPPRPDPAGPGRAPAVTAGPAPRPSRTGPPRRRPRPPPPQCRPGPPPRSRPGPTGRTPAPRPDLTYRAPATRPDPAERAPAPPTGRVRPVRVGRAAGTLTEPEPEPYSPPGPVTYRPGRARATCGCG